MLPIIEGERAKKFDIDPIFFPDADVFNGSYCAHGGECDAEAFFRKEVGLDQALTEALSVLNGYLTQLILIDKQGIGEGQSLELIIVKGSISF